MKMSPMNKGYVTLSQSELNRVLVIQRLVDGQLSVPDAAMVLGLSERHVKRLKARFKDQGPEGLVHGNRGRKPAHTIPDSVRQQVVRLAQSTYKGCNYTFFSELLQEHEGITISPSSVRRILNAAGIASPRKHRPPKLHRRRQRKAQFGMLIQIDGCFHDWLEGRGPWLVLHGAVDDATGRIVALTFRPTECFAGYRDLLAQIVLCHGIPLAIYSDRHTLFFPPERSEASLEQQLQGQVPLSQVGRMIVELGCEHIKARSPQAKGRIERLWETLQERLVVYLRLVGAKTLAEAEAALPGFIEQYNERFAVPPVEAEVAFRPVPPHLRLEQIFCWKEQRTIHPGYVIQFRRKTYRIITPRGAATIPLRTVVDVLEYPDGNLSVGWRGQIYPLQLIPDSPELRKITTTASVQHKTRPTKEKAGPTPTRRPAADHPWRKPVMIPKQAYCTTATVTNSSTSLE